MTASHVTLTASIAELKTTGDGIDATVKRLEHRTSMAFVNAREHNSFAKARSHTLVPVPHPDTGHLPLAELGFPGTIGDYSALRAGSIDGLLRFYSAVPRGDVSERRAQLGLIIGCHM